MPKIDIYVGDWIETLDELPADHFHCVITSPPYWRQRDYGGGDREVGQEGAAAEYVERLAAGFDHVARVMRDDGILWLNLGDKMSERSLLLLPERVAWAMRERGWILRARFPWIKTDGLPEPVTDRPVLTTEQIFMFVRRRDYFYDAMAIKRAAWEGRGDRNARDRDLIEAQLAATLGLGGYAEETAAALAWEQVGEFLEHGGLLVDDDGIPVAIKTATARYPGAHFATFPQALIEPLMLASSSGAGVCLECGAPYGREIIKGDPEPGQTNAVAEYGNTGHGGERSTLHMSRRWGVTGWRPSCNCGDETPRGKHKTAARILDPFAGAGTVGVTAVRHSRAATLIDLVEENGRQAETRIRQAGGLFADVEIKKVGKNGDG